MSKWKEYYDYYKRNPIEFYESYLGAKFTKLEKVKLKFHVNLGKYIDKLTVIKKELLYKMTLEPYKTTKHEIFRLRCEIIDLKINVIKMIFNIS